MVALKMERGPKAPGGRMHDLPPIVAGLLSNIAILTDSVNARTLDTLVF